MQTRAERIIIVNEIISEIAKRGRKFFHNAKTGKTAFIFERNKRLYMKSEDKISYLNEDIYLHTRFNFQPRNFQNGGTLWGLTLDFKDFIITGKKSNHNHGYGGLYCQAWGYPKEDMVAIQNLAIKLGYL